VPKDDALRKLSDPQLRGEVARRRLLYIALSIVVTLAALVLVTSIGQSGIGIAGGLVIILIALANLAIVVLLFRWMSAPSRERARRRRLSVLKMLGADQPEDADSEAVQEGERV
jgi:hypothetical protein